MPCKVSSRNNSASLPLGSRIQPCTQRAIRHRPKHFNRVKEDTSVQLLDAISMPGLLSTMDVSANHNSALDDAPNRRKSGRQIHKPVLYSEDPNLTISVNGSAKRKRAERVPDRDDEDMVDESSSEDDQGEPDEEESKDQRRRNAKLRNAHHKPAAKKPKTAKPDSGMKLAMRPATNGVKKPRKPKKPKARKGRSSEEGTGVYGEFLFVRGTMHASLTASS